MNVKRLVSAAMNEDMTWNARKEAIGLTYLDNSENLRLMRFNPDEPRSWHLIKDECTDIGSFGYPAQAWSYIGNKILESVLGKDYDKKEED